MVPFFYQPFLIQNFSISFSSAVSTSSWPPDFDQAAKSALAPLSVTCISSTCPVYKAFIAFLVLTIGIGQASPLAFNTLSECIFHSSYFLGFLSVLTNRTAIWPDFHFTLFFIIRLDFPHIGFANFLISVWLRR